ncbi:MAG: PQQ-dependent sugar dehydrogenase [Acidimicrobiales bacterium]
MPPPTLAARRPARFLIALTFTLLAVTAACSETSEDAAVESVPVTRADPADTTRSDRTPTSNNPTQTPNNPTSINPTSTSGPALATTSADPSNDVAGAEIRPQLGQVRVRLRQLATFTEPLAIATRPDDPAPGRFYVVERAGLIRAVEQGGSVVEPPVADLRALTAPGGERGLLGLAFSPDGAKLYVNYTDLDGNTNVDELTLTPAGLADPTSRRQVLFIEQPFANHNGGHLAFGPDAMLYIGTGDGGSGGDPQGFAQNPASLLGKMLRIDPTPGATEPYTVPADNPFVGRSGIRPEIWSLGLRNPWRYSFDEATGDLWIGDVGQNAMEEIDVVRAAEGLGKGVNYGWNAFEGTSRYAQGVEVSNLVQPYAEYGHGSGANQGCSITGGVVYRQRKIPNLAGAYLYADFCVPGIRALDADGDPVPVVIVDQPAGVASFGLDRDGDVLVVDLAGGLHRLEAAG